MRGFYVHLRKRIPAKWVTLLRTTPLLQLAHRLQPHSQAVYRLEGPLSGYRMSMPTTWVYPMTWGEYEPDSCQVISSYVRPGMTVVDIGGHIGYHTLLLAKSVGGDTGKVFCFEPVANNRKAIRRNLALNNLEERVVLEPLAVAERTALMVLYAGPSSSEASLTPTFRKTERSRQFSQIAATCDLDSYFSLLDWTPIHFIKMDIEGAESLAIRGMREVLRRFHPTLLVETHGEVARDGLKTLSNLGYQLQCLDVHGQAVASNFEAQPIRNEHWVARHLAQTGM
jgi:FkbM family methyltransferase